MLQAALPVPPTLTLPVTPDGFGVGLPILAGIIRMEVAPFPLTIPADLTVQRIGFDLPVVVVAPALALTIGVTANQLLRTKKGRLKRLVTITAAAIAHRVAPDQDASRSL
ncbi:MAG TPA: hypothetical protein VKM93_18320 [Terriglobia bacterium]|nr:hypothetical protein [Terriglobia bacterium]